jgi:CubicO group peptidase (beta-lactamase class C family)
MGTWLTSIAATLLVFTMFTTPAFADGTDASAQTYAQKIDEYVAAQMKQGNIPGVSIGIVEGNEITYLKGYGTADTKGTPVTPQTPFTICSVGKVFTALAIRQLANEHKLDYDAPVQKYIPWFTLADAKAASKITISNLIGHNSGLSEATGVEAYTYNSKYSIEQVVRKLSVVKPDRPVGQSFEYSNMNFIILGLVIEKVSGQTYEDYVKQKILDRLGMKNSYLSEEAAKQAELAMGHTVAFGITFPTNIPFPTAQCPAGFQLTSAEDMARFVSLYLNNGYISGVSIIPNNELPELKPPYEVFKTTDVRYNEYWVKDNGYPQGQGGYYGHVGGSSCFSTFMVMNPILKKGIVVLANSQNGSITAQTLGNGIASILSTGEIPVLVKLDNSKYLVSILLAIVLLGLLVFRAFWTRRFMKNVEKGGMRRIIALGSFTLLDAALPLAILLGLPLGFDMSWQFYIAANLELAIMLLTAAVGLAAIGIVKAFTLGRRTAAKALLDS